MSPNSFLQFEGLFFSIFVSFLSLAISTDPEFGDCLPKYCGVHQIIYPFWLLGEQPSYCGFLAFELTCINSSTLVFSNDDEVRNIFYTNNSLQVVSSKLVTKNCSVVRYNFTTSFHLTPFRISPTNKKLFFFSNCSSPPKETGYYPSCENGTYAYLGRNYTDGDGPSNSPETCTKSVVVPVLGSKGADGGDYERLTHDGFLLEWTVADCSPCLESKGHCGYDNSSNSFMCLCADGWYSKSCSTGNKSKLWIIITTASLASLICLSLICFLWIKRRRRSDSREEKEELHDAKTNEASILLRSQNSSSEFSLYNFSEIAEATNHFSPENKLGEGGFGPVYKGQLPKGINIAAKRLSTYSGQGLVEFKNEIQLIAKLQHRNLVSLIGCCIEGEEKILIYEYMPNKSLDFFLFDQTKGALLDWSKRFHIIEGIAQGLLYLHKHSRLRIIHRDLKVSNILLDNDMNPKISDFGMARIFGTNEIQANTNRVVGTYGYMSPEYAFEGVFSIKSDVFSFGVLLLEIVSGKRNAGFHQFGSSLNLLGYTWELWKEGKWSEIVDTSLGDGYGRDELMRCIHAALMCVQENPADRPTMSNVIAMLSSESSSFPIPKQPAFFNLRTTSEAEEIVDQGEINSSVNNITVTAPYGR